MIQSNSKRLVIDTDILVATSNRPNKRATLCRDILSSTLNICHKMVLTDRIEEEHRDKMFHRWVRLWLLKMNDKGKLVPQKELSASKPRNLRPSIDNSSLSKNAKERMRKDEHLIEAALWTDKRILSFDKVRDDFARLSETVDRIKPIIWLNPEKQTDECMNWLSDGAPNIPEFQLSKDKQ